MSTTHYVPSRNRVYTRKFDHEDQLDLFQQAPEGDSPASESRATTQEAVPPTSSPSGQLTELPGTTFEHIFEPPRAA